MSYAVVRTRAADRDLEAIFDFLLECYVNFGEDRAEAFERAAERVRGIESEMLALGDRPHQGTLRPELLPGLRSVTKRRAIFYFDIDEKHRVVRVLGVFFGGQDHQRHMLNRLLGS